MNLQPKKLGNRIYVYDVQDSDSEEFYEQEFIDNEFCESCHEVSGDGAWIMVDEIVRVGLCDKHIRQHYPVILNRGTKIA